MQLLFSYGHLTFEPDIFLGIRHFPWNQIFPLESNIFLGTVYFSLNQILHHNNLLRRISANSYEEDKRIHVIHATVCRFAGTTSLLHKIARNVNLQLRSFR